MKVAIGSFVTETHSFSTDLTTLECFKQCIWDEAKQLVDAQRGARGDGGGAVVGGYIDYAEVNGWDIMPLMAAGAWPAGPIPLDTYEEIKRGFEKELKKLPKDVDGILLHLHGAAVVEGLDDAEGDFLSFVRSFTGDEMPVVMLLDLHANISDLMVEKADAIFGYDTYPHVDVYEREQEAAAFLEKIVKGEVEPFMFRAQPPLILPAIRTTTDTDHMKKLMARANYWEGIENIENVAVFCGYYGSDKYETGASCVVITNNDTDLAMKAGRDMADLFWELRDDFMFHMMPVEEAIRTVTSNEGLWAFMDECDDPLGGGASDGIYLLKALMDAGIRSAGISVIKDPEIARKAWEAGIGGTVAGLLGAKTDKLHGEPVRINAKVVKLSDTEIPIYANDITVKQNVGKIAVLDQNGIFIVVVEYKGAFESINIFDIMGIDVRNLKVIVLKGSSGALKEVFREYLSGYVYPESKGITNPDVTKIGEFKKLRRPVYPLDKDVTMRYK